MSTSPARRFSLYVGPADAESSEGDGLSDSLTLPAFYDAYFLPMLRQNSAAGTVEQDRLALRRWVESTPNPRLRDIHDALAVEFVQVLAARKTGRGSAARPISANTVRKTCGHLQKILDAAGPKTRRRRRAACILDEVPYIERPAAVWQPPGKIYSLAEIGLWLSACPLAYQTKSLPGLDAPLWWRSLVIFAYNTGLRIETIMGATWPLVDRDLPGWITVPPAIAKGQRGGFYYLNRFAREAIDGLGTHTMAGALFPWGGWPKSANWLQACRRRILAKSELPPHRRFGFHGLRKALATFLAARNPMVASIVLGHRGGVTQRHYVDPAIVAELLEQVPQPLIQGGQDARQPLLF
jgi:integrase